MTDTASPPAASRSLTVAGALIINIALLTLLIGSMCGWAMAVWGTEDIHAKENARLAMVAGSVGGQISLAMTERRNEVRNVRDLFERELRGASAADKRAVMERLQRGNEHFSWMGVVGVNGGVRIGTGHLLEGQSVAGRNWFEGALRAPVFFGNVHPAKLLEAHIRNPDGTPLYLLDIALPLRGDRDEVIGVVGSHFNWRMIEQVIRQTLGALAATEKLSVAVVNSDGAILFDTRGAVGNVGALLARRPGAMIEAEWPKDGFRSLVAAVAVPGDRGFGLGWQIAVRKSSADVEVGVTRMKWQVAAASLATGLIFALLGVFAVRPVTLPLETLVDELKDFGESGVLPAAKRHAITEMDNLHRAFVDMAGSVVAQKLMLRDTQAEIVRTLGRAGEFRDNETGNHVWRMSLCAERLARLAGWDAAAAETLRLASQMHDVGKIGIPDHVLLKPGRFDAAERAIMERHCEIGARILAGIDTPLTVMARTVALTHHEHWDGGGYPQGLVGRQIPQEGRISAICDVFDALLSIRPYKDGWPLDKVVAFLREQSGRHFDPELAALFLANLDDFVAIRSRFRDEGEPALADGTLAPPPAGEAARQPAPRDKAPMVASLAEQP